ncbi:hypothetical protein [Bradyrhizobium genosp. P]|uniref:hypothetical protein n=1 Tax=Bradyrhizobium genosp. P TaxID=83641 RepID=UPI003CEDDD06
MIKIDLNQKRAGGKSIDRRDTSNFARSVSGATEPDELSSTVGADSDDLARVYRFDLARIPR